ncbi:hypothetical protein [Cupriavidus oxalaticus]|uniref:hypothetical protein n=1 Tax=Cupriavidus oxalaticus TaxID=96344 RepID=UPI004034EBA0
MKAAPLTLNRLEFTEISVSSNEKFEPKNDCYAPQLTFDFSGCMFRRKSFLKFPDEELDQPKNFALRFELALSKEDQTGDICPPYFFNIIAQAFVTVGNSKFDGDPAELFRAVRFTGYTMIYGAMREMLANLTARSTHGMLQLPSAQFHETAREESVRDEARRKERLLTRTHEESRKEAIAIQPPVAPKPRKAKGSRTSKK